MYGEPCACSFTAESEPDRLRRCTAAGHTRGFGRGTHGGVRAVTDTSGLMFFELLFLNFLTLFTSLFTFPDERAITVKERQSGMYRVSAYFVCRAFQEVHFPTGTLRRLSLKPLESSYPAGIPQ